MLTHILSYHLSSIYISKWFTVCFVRLYFVRHFGSASVKLQHSLCDASVRTSTFLSTIRFVQSLCDRTFTVLKSHFEQIGHLYDIEFWD